jgi:hypothetical protein
MQGTVRLLDLCAVFHHLAGTHSVVCRCMRRRHKQRLTGLRAGRSPCVVITAPDDINNPSLQ